MGHATTESVCPHCGAKVPPHEAAEGWCESCGKKLPPSMQVEAKRKSPAVPAGRGTDREPSVASSLLVIAGVLAVTAASVAALLWWR